VVTADELFNRACAAHQTGDHAAAESGYRQLLAILPTHPACLTNLGALVARRGDLDEAEQLYRRALAANPNQFDTHFNLGNLYRRLKRFEEAAAEYEEVLRAAPNAPLALVNLGLTVSATGNWPRAVECYARAAAVAPDLPEVLIYLGDALANCGRQDQAVLALRESVTRFPDVPRGHYNLGLHLGSSGATEEAIAAFQRALALKQDYPDAQNALGMALEAAGRTDDALGAYREAVRLRPDFAAALYNLGTCLARQGRSGEATEALQQSLALDPNPLTQSVLLANRLYSANLTAEQLRDEHIAWAEGRANTFTPGTPLQKRPRAAPERIRVGYVFSEFRSRAGWAFFEALLTHHDHAGFHITAYANVLRQNESLARLRKLADVWKPVARLSDEQLAQLIRADEIDILVDLNGHTAGNRLLAFARKPAPTQIGLFGYLATTGLKAMDYHISDFVLDPPDQADALYVEKLLRLPDLAWVYVPPSSSPDPTAQAAPRGRSFTFGCLNHPGKLSESCVDAWAAVLGAVPDSHLVLLVGDSTASREALAARFTARGISSDRLELVSRMPADAYYEAYRALDLALDPFPYNGGSTTCDALWMGVPVLTVAGRDARGRQGVSIMNALGLPEFVADSPEQLVPLAATWADQRQSLADIRGVLREIVMQSPVATVANYVKQLEEAYRGV
jgi:predicted O-linked N-acetylglucosamine transferase (SPINDLY family)